MTALAEGNAHLNSTVGMAHFFALVAENATILKQKRLPFGNLFRMMYFLLLMQNLFS